MLVNKKSVGVLVFAVTVGLSTSACASSLKNASDLAVCLPPQVNWNNYEWVLMKGEKQPACQEMLDYLRSRPKSEPPPVCLKERLPPTIHWTRPDWKVLPEEKKEAMLKQASSGGQRLLPKLREAKEWKIVRLDITQDDEPETLLALGPGSADCYKVTRCAAPEGKMKAYISLTSAAGGDTSLLPMTDDGEHIRFAQTRGKLLTRYGELIFYKEHPYWISPLRWEQKYHDDYVHHKAEANPKNKYNRMFQMAPLKPRMATNRKKRKTDFKNASAMYPDPAKACFFGYFHRDNLK